MQTKKTTQAKFDWTNYAKIKPVEGVSEAFAARASQIFSNDQHPLRKLAK